MVQIIKITPVSKGNIREWSKGCMFDVWDEGVGRLRCRNKYLYGIIELGKELEVSIGGGRFPVILSVSGFVPPETPVDEDLGALPESRPINKAEAILYDKLVNAGWDVTRRGWPDFACFKNGKFIAVEVKPKRSHKLKRRQRQVMEVLADGGIRCYRWSPNGGFRKVVRGVELP